MKKILPGVALICLALISNAQTTTLTPILYGEIDTADLKAAPYSEWYSTNFSGYSPDSNVIARLSALKTSDVRIEIFLGTWCGDSKREVPRFLKVLQESRFPLQRVKMIGVGGGDSLQKQSPLHEEAGKGVFRVPVFIVYKKGVEINRINEFPILSLEKDLYSILTADAYAPNYRSFSLVRTWLSDGTLLDKNINHRGLATQLRPLISGENELNSLGYLLQAQGKTQEAHRIFLANAALYPESANILSSLGESHFRLGDRKNAVQLLEKALALTKDTLLSKDILAILYMVKSEER
ncbi:MAG: tetratricopeptide repeat protein [Chitinophagaceae bacterium]|nr:tetratricopeptide repeat protein [Chitinophagaceae bacterium]